MRPIKLLDIAHGLMFLAVILVVLAFVVNMAGLFIVAVVAWVAAWVATIIAAVRS